MLRTRPRAPVPEQQQRPNELENRPKQILGDPSCSSSYNSLRDLQCDSRKIWSNLPPGLCVEEEMHGAGVHHEAGDQHRSEVPGPEQRDEVLQHLRLQLELGLGRLQPGARRCRHDRLLALDRLHRSDQSWAHSPPWLPPLLLRLLLEEEERGLEGRDALLPSKHV